MEQHISQEEVRRIIISDMVKKRNSIVPIIGEDTIVYKDKGTGKEIPFQEFILNEFQKKYPHVDVSDSERGFDEGTGILWTIADVSIFRKAIS